MKNKRILGTTLAVSLIGSLFVSVGGAKTAKADEADLADQSFVQFLLEDSAYQGELSYTHSPLYDEELSVNGRQYDFSIGSVEGYALVAEIQEGDQIFYEIEELFYGRQSPFDECEGLPVYVTHGLYLDYKNQAFYDLATDTVMDGATVAENAYKGFGYCGFDGSTTEVTQTITYATKETETYSIQFDLPDYGGSVNGVTSCANTAGAILIGYYDRFCPNIMPDFQSYVQLGPAVCYKGAASEIADLILELHTLMGTDVNQQGTTYSGFQSGMQQYVTDKGYTYTTTSLFSNGSLNMNAYKTSVQNGKPVAIFLSGFALLAGREQGENTETITSDYINNSHVAVGCGYKTETYYDASGQLIDTRHYLKVSTGIATCGIGYLNMNGLGEMDRAISVDIS